MLLTFACVHAVFFPSTRYRAPVEFVFLFYAGVAAGTWIEHVAGRTSGTVRTKR